MGDVVAIVFIVLVVGGACYYIYKSKKKGVKCIGCPQAGTCSRACSSNEAKQNLSQKKADK